MSATTRKVALNRPVFSQRAFDSAALTVLATLIHRCEEPGGYEVAVRRGGALVQRFAVRVTPEAGVHQVNVDLAAPDPAERGCGCGGEGGYELAVGGALVFYVSRGTGRYTVTVRASGGAQKDRGTVLDSSAEVPRGDLFAVTLVRPGTYRVRSSAGKAEGTVRVRLPKGDKSYRSDRPTLVEVGKKGVVPRGALDLYSGQSVVLQVGAPGRIRLELVEDDTSAGEPFTRGRLTHRRRRKRAQP